MNLNDIELLEKITAKHKYRYEVLDSCFEKTIINTLIYIPINITLLLTELKEFGDSLDDKKDFNLHCAIAVMNLFAHYKHYYMIHDAARVIIIGFVKDSFYYKQFHEIISVIENICEFMPHIYFMGDVASIKHTILVGAYISYINSITVSGLPSSIHIYSSLNVDKQLLCLFPTKESYKISKPMGQSAVEFLTKRQFIQKLFKDNETAFSAVRAYKPELERLSVIVGVFLGTYECHSQSEKKQFSFSFKRETVRNRSLHLLDFFQRYYDKGNTMHNINNQLVAYLKSFLAIESELDSFKAYVNRYDYFFHEGRYMHNIMKELYNAYKVKILDYEIAKESEKYRSLITHPLYTNWLLF
jgi:hypothetical protein